MMISLSTMLPFALLSVSLALAVPSLRAQPASPPTPTALAPREADNHARLQLVHDSGHVTPGQETTIALYWTMDEHWHMYWNGYSEQGMSPTWTVSVPETWQVVGEPVWPVPSRKQSSQLLVEHIYDDQLPILLRVRAGLQPASGTSTVRVEAKWLICNDACVPERASATISLRMLDASDAPAAPDALQAAAATPPLPTFPRHALLTHDQGRALIEAARASASRVLSLSSPRAQALGLALTVANDTYTIRATDASIEHLAFFPADACWTPSSDAGDWLAPGLALEIPVKSPGQGVSTPAKEGTAEKIGAENPLIVAAPCLQGLLEVAIRSAGATTREYFLVKTDRASPPGTLPE